MDRPTKEQVDAAMAEVWDKFEHTDWPNEESSVPSTEQILEAEVRALREELTRLRLPGKSFGAEIVETQAALREVCVAALVKAARALIAERDNPYSSNYHDQIEDVREALMPFEE